MKINIHKENTELLLESERERKEKREKHEIIEFPYFFMGPLKIVM